jgi:threonine/homoserine/homoserine lactone efflux protein
VLSASVSALTFLRFAGAAYLILLGVQRWRSAETAAAVERAPLGQVFAQGLVTQLLNPKVAVFFVAFLPQFLNPAEPIATQVVVLGAVYIAIAVAIDATYVMSAAALSRRFIASSVAQRRAGRIAAVSYMALGLAAAATGVRRP